METESVKLTKSEIRLIHELMLFMPSAALDEARKKLIDGPECDMKREFAWGDFLRRQANEVYKSLAHKLDQHIMVAPSVIRKSLEGTQNKKGL